MYILLLCIACKYNYYCIHILLKEYENFSNKLCVFLFFVPLLQHIHTLVTLVSHSHNLLSKLLLLDQ